MYKQEWLCSPKSAGAQAVQTTEAAMRMDGAQLGSQACADHGPEPQLGMTRSIIQPQQREPGAHPPKRIEAVSPSSAACASDYACGREDMGCDAVDAHTMNLSTQAMVNAYQEHLGTHGPQKFGPMCTCNALSTLLRALNRTGTLLFVLAGPFASIWRTSWEHSLCVLSFCPPPEEQCPVRGIPQHRLATFNPGKQVLAKIRPWLHGIVAHCNRAAPFL